MAVSLMLLSAYQGWGQVTAPFVVSVLRVAIALIGGWLLRQQLAARLDWLYSLAKVPGLSKR